MWIARTNKCIADGTGSGATTRDILSYLHIVDQWISIVAIKSKVSQMNILAAHTQMWSHLVSGRKSALKLLDPSAMFGHHGCSVERFIHGIFTTIKPYCGVKTALRCLSRVFLLHHILFMSRRVMIVQDHRYRDAGTLFHQRLLLLYYDGNC